MENILSNNFEIDEMMARHLSRCIFDKIARILNQAAISKVRDKLDDLLEIELKQYEKYFEPIQISQARELTKFKFDTESHLYCVAPEETDHYKVAIKILESDDLIGSVAYGWPDNHDYTPVHHGYFWFINILEAAAFDAQFLNKGVGPIKRVYRSDLM